MHSSAVAYEKFAKEGQQQGPYKIGVREEFALIF
jgi:hypothetical protein